MEEHAREGSGNLERARCSRVEKSGDGRGNQIEIDNV
jgi:hypothetical protein